MPVDRGAAIQLGLLLLVVPAQYLIAQWFSSTESQRSFAIKNLVSEAAHFKDQYLSWKSWRKWCVQIINKISPSSTTPHFEGQDDPNGQSPAIEVISYKDPQGFFAESTEPRDPRPPSVKYRVGQVVKHKRWGYRGIIIGWDEVAKAPESWLKSMHPEDKPHWRTMPNYAILVDTRDRLSPQITYVPQDNLNIIINTQILHPSIDDYFEHFDGAQYIPRPWLKALYPHDS